MKFSKILVLTLSALMMAGEVQAQVSVRRTAKSSTTEQSAKGSKNAKEVKTQAKAGKADDKGEKPSKPVNAIRPNASKSNAAAGNATIRKEGEAVAKKSAGKSSKSGAATQTVYPNGKTLRQQAFDDYQKDVATETPWQHIVYRELDLTKDENASLYFPVEPMEGLTSLFRVIIEHFSKGELPAYEYLDGREVFTDKYLVKPKDIFEKNEIFYKVVPPAKVGGKETYLVEESDVPSSLVLSYIIKERWEFDQKHSRYQARILCISPVLHESGSLSADAVKYPLFWINFEDLRPFLRNHLIVSQGMNTAARYTMEEFFTLGQYKGDILKEQNLRGLTLKQQVGDNPDSLRMAQEKLDNDLRAFRDSIWVKDPEPVKPVDKRAERAAARAANTNSAAEKDNSQAEADPSAKKNRRTKEAVDMNAAAEEKEAKATTHRSVRR